MARTPVDVNDIVFYGSRAAAGDLSRTDAALGLVEATFYRLDVDAALQLVDTWQAYLTTRPTAPVVVRSGLLSRASARLPFTRRNRKETPAA